MKGKIAICSLGYPGIITSDDKQEITYPDGSKGTAYVGVCLLNGKSWCSRNPTIVGTFEEFKDSGFSFDDWIAHARS